MPLVAGRLAAAALLHHLDVVENKAGNGDSPPIRCRFVPVSCQWL